MTAAWTAVALLAFVVLFATFPWWAVVAGIYAVSIPSAVIVWAVEC